MNHGRIQGVLSPVVTPFRSDLSPDAERFVRHCRWLLSQNVGLAAFGTNSEANSLSADERIELLDHLVAAGLDTSRMMPGTGCCALPETVRLTAHAMKVGCAGVLMLPPFYYKGVSDDGLFRSFAEVIERVGDRRLRVYLYHIPPVAQVPITLGLIERLLKAYPDNVAGIKDSSGDWANTKAVLDAFAASGFDVFPGSETFLLASMRAGGGRLHQRDGQHQSRPHRPAPRDVAGRGCRPPAAAARRDPHDHAELRDDPRPQGGHRALGRRSRLDHRPPAPRPAHRGAGGGPRHEAREQGLPDAGPRRTAELFQHPAARLSNLPGRLRVLRGGR